MPPPDDDKKNVAQEIKKVKQRYSQDYISVPYFQTLKMFRFNDDFSFPQREISACFHRIDMPVKGAQVDM